MLGEVGKVRYWANQLTFLHWKSEMYYSRQALLDQVDSTQYLWKSLLHGNPEENLTGSVLNDPAQVEIIQGQECLRIDKTLCRPSDNMYYEDVSHGLGVLLEIYLTNARCEEGVRSCALGRRTRGPLAGMRRAALATLPSSGSAVSCDLRARL